MTGRYTKHSIQPQPILALDSTQSQPATSDKTSPDTLKHIFGIENRNTCNELLQQTLCVAPNHEDAVDGHVESVATILQSIGPRDSLEGMLSVQMIVVHNLAMSSLAGAAEPGQSAEGIDMNVNRATKLLRTFAAQVDALDRHRRPVSQQMLVGNVNVNDGGQAIVGSVTRPAPEKDPDGSSSK